MFNTLWRIVFAPVTDEGLGAAISEAVVAATPEDVKNGQEGGGDGAADEGTDGGAPGSETEGGDPGKGGDPAAGGGDGKGGDGAGDDTEELDADGKPKKKPGDGAAADEGTNAGGRERDESGRFKAKGKDPAAAGAEPGADGAGKGKPPAKPDPVNDPIPDEIKGRTRERMESLVGTAKKLQGELTAETTRNSELMRAIGETGTTPEQFGATMDILGQLNSRDPTTKRAGVEALRKMADDVALKLGEPIPGKDPLEGHQDLLDEVEEGTLTKARAIELATARNRTKANTQATAEETEQQQRAAAINTGKDALNTLEGQLKAKDGALYAVKRKAIEGAFAIACETLPPQRWAAAYQRMYDNAQVTAPAPRPGTVVERAPAGSGGRNPQRPAKPAQGGGKAEPKSLEEAIDHGLELARGAR